MRWILFLALLGVSVPLAAEEIKAPTAGRCWLEVAHARAAGKGSKRTIILRVLNTQWQNFTVTKKVPETVTEIVDGKPVTKTHEREITEFMQRSAVRGFREVTLPRGKWKAQNASGEEVSPATVIQNLQAETPVLLCFEKKVEPYFLSTTNPDTLILFVDCEQVYPTPQAAIPAIPVESQPAEKPGS